MAEFGTLQGRDMYRLLIKFWSKVLGLKPTTEWNKRARSYEEVPHEFTSLLATFTIIWGLLSFILGVAVADNPDYCRMKSIGDFMIAPAYAIGCNIGKDRWDIRVN